MTRHGFPSLAALAALALLATTPAMADPPAHAKAWGHQSRQDDRGHYDRRYDDRYRRDRDFDDVRYRAAGHRHDRHCDHRDVRRVYVVERLPRGHRHIDHRGHRYYYDRHGQWFEPYGGAYARIASPAGLLIDSRGIAVVANVPIVRW